jgi:predicted nucleic acid-binding protein
VNGYLVDTSVLIDVATDDPIWADWSQGQLDVAAESGPIMINPIVYAELSAAYERIETLDAMLDDFGIELRDIPRPALFVAARVFVSYRRRGGMKTGVLPDFLIGAHAAVEGFTLLTRDVRRRGWFPTLQVVSPAL